MKKILDFFSSLKLALILFFILILMSAIGSFISAANPTSGLIDFLSRSTGKSHQQIVFFLQRYGLLDLYHSKIFVVLLIFFTINIVVCTLKRLPSIVKIFLTDVTNTFKVNEEKEAVKISSDKETKDIINQLYQIFKGYKTDERTLEDNVIYFRAERGRVSRIGVHVVHFGVLVLILSGIMGNMFGYNGNIAILEGDIDDTVIMKDNKSFKLPFSVKLNNVLVSYYDNTTKPKDFSSEIVIKKDGKPDEFYTIGVNRPLKYEGLKIFQASYGFYPSKDVQFKFLYRGTEGEKRISAKMDELVSITNELGLVVRDFIPSLSMDSEGKLININDVMINPAVLVEFFYKGASQGIVPILANYPDTWRFQGFDLQFEKAYGVQFSVFSINYNPFIPLIYIGFVLLSVGIVIAYIVEHKIIYIKIVDNGKRREIIMSGYRHRFKQDTLSMLESIGRKIDQYLGVEK
ncbi:MAG: cytochrome c biogenesis protein ResB [Calditerrivibrio sp.]|nr:cytochrome c biogenesis protein ResB [Calditerrivibrio sp.]